MTATALLSLLLTSSVLGVLGGALITALFNRRKQAAETLKLRAEAHKTELDITAHPFKILTEEINSTDQFIAFVRKMAGEVVNLQNEVMALRKEKETATDELEKVRTENAALKKELDENKTELEKLRGEITRLKNLMKAHKIET